MCSCWPDQVMSVFAYLRLCFFSTRNTIMGREILRNLVDIHALSQSSLHQELCGVIRVCVCVCVRGIAHLLWSSLWATEDYEQICRYKVLNVNKKDYKTGRTRAKAEQSTIPLLFSTHCICWELVSGDSWYSLWQEALIKIQTWGFSRMLLMEYLLRLQG